jgi:hypothetical protein
MIRTDIVYEEDRQKEYEQRIIELEKENKKLRIKVQDLIERTERLERA